MHIDPRHTPAALDIANANNYTTSDGFRGSKPLTVRKANTYMARQSVPEAPIDETAYAINAEVEANAEAPKPKPRQNRNTYTIPVTVPTALHEMLVARAESEQTNATQIARRLLADYVNYTLPLLAQRAPKRKFATKEDAIAFRKDRNARAKALLAALDSGEIDEAMLARFLAAQGNGAVPVTASEPEAVPA